MLRNDNVKAGDVIGKFVDSVETLIDDIMAQDEKFRKIGESELTRAHYAQKLIDRWFWKNGS